MDARLILADEPGAWVTFMSQGRRFRGRMDPMWIGAEKVAALLSRPQLVLQLLDEASRTTAMIGDPFCRKTVVLLQDWADAVGLGFHGLGLLQRGLSDLARLEVDLVRMGVEIRDWLDPAGSVSSRRMALLIGDLVDRPESRMGAAYWGVQPITKGGIVLAQISDSFGGDGRVHMFLKSEAEIEAEQRAREEDAAKRERIKAQRPTEIVAVKRTAESFASAKASSLAELEKILAGG